MSLPRSLCDAEELAQLVRAGDPEALDRATRCFGHRLRAIARKICGRTQDADDAVQDAWLSAREHLQDWRGEGKLEAWLTRMVINACHHMHRGRKNDPGLHDVEAELVDFSTNPELEASRLEIAESLAAALERLSPRNRAILLLADVEGWKGPEIAEHLEMTPDAVRAQLRRSRSAMRDGLARDTA